MSVGKNVALAASDVIEALRLWHVIEAEKWPLRHLRLGLEIQQEFSEHGSLLGYGPAAQNRSMLNLGLDVLRTRAPEAEDLLRARFENRRDVLAVANSLNIAESSFYYRQRQAINLLTEVLTQLEVNASDAWKDRMLSRLEVPSYSKLVGIEGNRNLLLDALSNESDHFIVSIDGLGGMGKTALADLLTRELIEAAIFDEIAWITAKQTFLSAFGRLQVESGRPALTFLSLLRELVMQFDLPGSGSATQFSRQESVKRYLRQRKCLVVIDNLETVSDFRDLIPTLRQWQRPSKFLLTSRLKLLDEMSVYSLSLEELPAAAAMLLIRNEARSSGVTSLLNADDSDLMQIYRVVGGNPLALKLVVGQLRLYSLSDVLRRLSTSHAQSGGVGLFDYIYRENWESLSDASKNVLLALTEAGEMGFSFEHLMEVAELDDELVFNSLEELLLLSMVEIGGSIKERRYRLHRLTEMFLLRMIAE